MWYASAGLKRERGTLLHARRRGMLHPAMEQCFRQTDMQPSPLRCAVESRRSAGRPDDPGAVLNACNVA